MSDIRHFFKKFKPNDSKSVSEKIDLSEKNQDKTTTKQPGLEVTPSSSGTVDTLVKTNKNISSISYNQWDIGLYLKSNVNTSITDEIRLKLLRDPWVPPQSYDFKNDVVTESKVQRAFRFEWLKTYPWLAYSAFVKGPLCRVCVAFRPPTHCGYQGQFIVSPCIKYNKFHEEAQRHMQSDWHSKAMSSKEDFERIMDRQKPSVHASIDTAYNKIVEENRVKLRSILSAILFCGQHDLPFRGKTEEWSVFTNLLQFRVDSGDHVLKEHLQSGARNSLYISHQIQNELIETCAEVLKDEILKEVRQAKYFSVLADETADIGGTEQLSIGVRYVNFDDEIGEPKVCEEFLGYIPLLEKLDSETISNNILQFLAECNLDLNYLVGQGYDGCSTMAGHVSGVQTLIRQKHPKALFFHCASHVLNLVINDLNSVKEVRNAIGTTKEIIKFFRVSPLRRKKIPNIPLFRETRWSSKYKSTRIFFENFEHIVDALQELSENAQNRETQNKAFQLYTVARTPTYIVAMVVIAAYSAKLEPVCTKLQAVNLNIKAVHEHILTLSKVFEAHRENAAEEFNSIFLKASESTDLQVELKAPRVVGIQTNKSNHPADNVEEFFRRSIFIPYLDSLTSSLRDRFSPMQEKAFSLMQLHPMYMKKMNKSVFLEVIEEIKTLYGDLLPNFTAEASTWHDVWRKDNASDKSLQDTPYESLLTKASNFYPSVAEAVKIGLTLPATTCSIERSFSTLRRVKTWNRSTMGHGRLSGLCMLSLHRKRVQSNEKLIVLVIEKFGQKPRRLKLLFEK